MKRFFILALLLICCPGLGACSRTSDPPLHKDALLPLPPDPVDPPDTEVRRAMSAHLKRTGAPTASIYDIRRVDLNRDGRREALVLLKSPYGYWCGTHGCTLMILKAHDDHFTFMNTIRPVRPPLYVAEAGQNGWRDLIIRVSGRWSKTKNVALQFNGRQYPHDPATLPPSLRYAARENTRLFYK